MVLYWKKGICGEIFLMLKLFLVKFWDFPKPSDCYLGYGKDLLYTKYFLNNQNSFIPRREMKQWT